MGYAARAAAIVRKGIGQARLLRRDPEAVARNLTQYTHPERFLARLKDYPVIRPVAAMSDPDAAPRVNVLFPSIGPDRMTGGPNTVLQLGCAIAEAGIPVRLVSCDEPAQGGESWLLRHVEQVRSRPAPANLSLADTAGGPLAIGRGDRFVASFWTTAHQAQALLPLAGAQQFFYLIQDFEPGFYPWSSRHALALKSYDLRYHPIVNEATLADYFAGTATGRFAEPDFRRRCTVFEPALDRAVFKPADRPRPAGRRLLIYARPTNPRNMLGMALQALELALGRGAFADGGWAFLAVGSRASMPDVRLKSGVVVREQPWADYRAYAGALQDADILLCPMLSPHTSYPVLEMAACGNLAVTTVFASKTAARLQAISPNIIPAEPTAESLAEMLIEAERTLGHADRSGRVTMPTSWDEALRPVVELFSS